MTGAAGPTVERIAHESNLAKHGSAVVSQHAKQNCTDVPKPRARRFLPTMDAPAVNCLKAHPLPSTPAASAWLAPIVRRWLTVSTLVPPGAMRNQLVAADKVTGWKLRVLPAQLSLQIFLE
jgi:hypothetical protein